MKFVLPPKNDGDGAKIRVLIGENWGPDYKTKGYTPDEAAESMRLMDKVLRNRLHNPAKFMAKGGKTVGDLLRAPKQFEGYEKYPDYSDDTKKRIQKNLNNANDAKHPQNADFALFISIAFDVVNGPPISDPSPGTLAGWREVGHGSPFKNCKLYKTIMGNSFYYLPKSEPESKPELGDFTEPNLKYA